MRLVMHVLSCLYHTRALFLSSSQRRLHLLPSRYQRADLVSHPRWQLGC